MFVDECEVEVIGGRGGDGIVAFLREKYRPHGGPAGGDGGLGGSVVFEASDAVDTLLGIRRMAKIKAENGKPGANKNMHGRFGRDRVIRVPLGTIVRDAANGALLAEITTPGMKWVAAKGGRGGRGNQHFATPRNQAPRTAEQGRQGQRRRLRLELKLIADAGLVGLPNAGKSTLLASISSARPKIANYPFTTLTPAPAVVSVGDYREMVVADLPGLIEGASSGAGLGAEFLRHIERTSIIVHLIELVPPDGSDPAENYRTIRAELEKHSATLAAKPEIVAGSKLDVSGAKRAAKRLEKELGAPVIAFSSASKDNLDQLLAAIWTAVRAERQKAGNPIVVPPPRVPPHKRGIE